MKCPKCHYLSFEPEPRCRNCGYDLALSGSDLELGRKEEPEVLEDLELRSPEATVTAAQPEPSREPEPAFTPAYSAPEPRRRAAVPRRVAAAATATARTAAALAEAEVEVRPGAMSSRPRRPRRPAPATTELPLFVKDVPPDEPTNETPSEPFAPRSDVEARGRRAESAALWSDQDDSAADQPTHQVRRPKLGTSLGGRPANEAVAESLNTPASRQLGTFRRELLQDLERLERSSPEGRSGRSRQSGAVSDVPVALRLRAAVVDGGLLGGIAAAVVWLTLRWSGLSMGEFAVLPLVPLGGFVVLVALGYLLLFTAAGGQTLGKMACGLRVVGVVGGSGSSADLTLQQACLRAALTIPSVLVFGLGFLPALLGDQQALHDRFAETRVVRT